MAAYCCYDYSPCVWRLDRPNSTPGALNEISLLEFRSWRLLNQSDDFRCSFVGRHVELIGLSEAKGTKEIDLRWALWLVEARRG